MRAESDMRRDERSTRLRDGPVRRSVVVSTSLGARIFNDFAMQSTESPSEVAQGHSLPSGGSGLQ